MIIICPYARPMPGMENKENPKNYPYWKELISKGGPQKKPSK
jgi:hypothetical protein